MSGSAGVSANSTARWDEWNILNDKFYRDLREPTLPYHLTAAVILLILVIVTTALFISRQKLLPPCNFYLSVLQASTLLIIIPA
ncbi:hypothetical protein HK102_010734, partial [Quaeritorhiza haematococci]